MSETKAVDRAPARGVIPAADYAFLHKAGVAAVFGPGSNIPRAASEILTIVRERRRSFRCPVAIPAAVVNDGVKSNCQVVNLSEGGMAIAESPALKPGGQVKVVFTLPGQADFFTFDSEVCWYDDKGRAGLRSLNIPPEQHSALQNWLSIKLEEDLPESVALQFRRT